MKKIVFFLTAILFYSLLWAQTPQGISHQAVIRNISNEVVTNSTVGIRVSILQGSPTGTVIYRETHTPVSNSNGLITYIIGKGDVGTGVFGEIDWSNGPYFLKTEADPAGGTNYTITGVTEILSVPYALHAQSAENITGTITETDPVFNASVAKDITAPDTTNWNNKSEFNGQYSSLTGTPTLAPVATSGSYDDLSSKPEIPTTTSQLTNNSGFLTTEVDGSVTNEIQALSRSNDTIYLSNGGFVKLPATFDGQYSSLSGTPTLAPVATSGSYADLTDQPDIPTNTSQLTNNSGFLTAEVDGSMTNELQALSRSNDTIYLSNGGFVKLPATFDGQYSSLSGTPALAPVATSGSYTDLTGQPDIPTSTSDLTNNSGFLTSEVDGSVSNEIQALSRSNDTIYLSNGGFVKLPATDAWNLNGNSGTISGTNFIGTSDNVPVNFKVNGQKAGKIDPSGPTFFGYQAGNSNMNNGNTGYGYQSLFSNTTGENNNSIGYQALYTNTTGFNNIANGYQALFSNTTGNQNIAIGFMSLNSNTTGDVNTAVGIYSLQRNTTGRENTAFGRVTLCQNTTGVWNTAIGSVALLKNTTGNENTAIGYGTLSNKDSGNRNTAIGAGAGNDNVLGNGNIFLGYHAGWNETGSDKLYIANSNTATPLIYGDFSTNTLKIFNNLNVNDEYTFPSTDGTAGQVLYTNGAGIAGWKSIVDSETDPQVGTNTTNYLSKWDGSSLVTSSMYDNGKVGIGTNNPSKLLFINGSTWPTSDCQFEISSGNVGSLSLSVNGIDNAQVAFDCAWENGGFRSKDAGSNFDILKLNDNFMFRYASGVSIGAPIHTMQNAILINTAGNIGIGTDTPNNKMDIEGGTVIGAAYSGTNTAPVNGLLVEGNLGIGKTSASTALDVNGIITATGGTSTNWNTAFGWGNHANAGYFKNGGEVGGAYRSLGNTDNYGLGIITNNTERFHITNNGNIGIGTTNPGSDFEVAGLVRFRGNSTNFGVIVDANGNLRVGSNGSSSSAMIEAASYSDNELRITKNSMGAVVLHRKDSVGYILSESGEQEKRVLAFGQQQNANGTIVEYGRFSETGNLGVGTTSPQNKLDVLGGAVIGPSFAGTTSSPANGLLVEGNVGIGKTSASTALDVNGIITATNGTSTNWNTAYGWGNHASAGYLTSYTETDPIFNGWNKSTGVSITASQVTDFQTNVSNNSDVMANTAKNSYPTADATKLAGIAAGAEVNVNADWNAGSGDAQILNKPALAAVATSGSFNDLANKPAGNNPGDMQYWNGSAWVMVPVGQPGQFLQLTASNIPAWAGNSYPSLTTSVITSITDISATGGGNVTNDGGASVTTRGVCWNTTPNPTTANSKTIDSIGTGTFVSSITGLTANTTYHVRAYATNSSGTAYGNDISFITFSSTDYDGNNYTSITIGTQVWMGENLKTTKYNDNTDIPNVTDNSSWAALSSPAYCWYNNDAPSNKNTYGAIYNWYTVNTGKLCPTEWHVPNNAEWATLKTFLGGESIAGGKLKETGTTHWSSPNTGATNETGFTALPGGYRVFGFTNINTEGEWWSATELPVGYAYNESMSKDASAFGQGYNQARYGFSVRCLKNAPPTIITDTISGISSTTAISGGNVTADGGESVTVCGVCWNTSPNPTTANSKTTDGTGTGTFTSSITGLTPGQLYYVRAYVTNSLGTAYGDEVSFTTYAATDFDGNNYTSVPVGTQVWLVENLKTTKFNDGTGIPNVTGGGAWASTSTPAYCWYNNDYGTYGSIYGAMYNSFAVNSGNLCPVGWHVPNATEFTSLITFLGGQSIAGGKLKETGTTHWISPNTGATNEIGFTALPSGQRYPSNGVFMLIRERIFLWGTGTDGIYLFYDITDVILATGMDNRNGLAVRCLKD